MKRLLAIVVFISACGSKDSKNKTAESADTTKSAVVDTTSTINKDSLGLNIDAASVIGTPFKLGKIEVAAKDLPMMLSWDPATAAVKGFGDGWRLPTKDELNEIYKNKSRLGGFANDTYWTSEEKDEFNARTVNFSSGKEGSFSKIYSGYTRPVRSL